jgi:hypothetical protein
MAWIDKEAPIGLVGRSLALMYSSREGDPGLIFTRVVFGFATPVDVYAGKFPRDPPFELAVGKSFGIPVSIGPTALTMRLINYIREGYPFVETALDEGTLSPDDVAGELHQATTRSPGVINWVPLAVAGGAILGGTMIVAYFISIFVRARRGQVTVTGPITELGKLAVQARKKR